MTDNVNMQSVLNRVKKMLALSQGTNFEHEADAALRMAHKMLAKHNLTMSDLRVTDEPDIVQDRVINAWTSTWVKIVYNAIAKLYFCEYIYMRVNPRISHIVVGRPHNIAVVHSMVEYVVKNIARLGRVAAKENTHIRSYGNSFKIGAAHSVAKRCSQMIEDAKKQQQEVGDGKGMVLADFYKTEMDAVGKFIKKEIIGVTTKGTRQSRANAEAYNAGRKAGDNISLNPQMNARANAHALPK